MPCGGAAGGVFKLIVNDGKADRLLMATSLLNMRIRDVMCARRRRGYADITPTLVDLEKTHIIFVSAHFKPFAAIGYEYQRISPQSGTVQLGNSVQFSIPQFGDFFNDMVFRARFDSIQCATGTAPTQPSAEFPADAAPLFYQLVDAFGNVIAGGATHRNLVRWCEFPGNRLFDSVRFDVNGNPLDEYTVHASSMKEKFGVPSNKREGYNRLVGQENKIEGVGCPGSCVIDTLDPTDLDGVSTQSVGAPAAGVYSITSTTTTNAFTVPDFFSRPCVQVYNGLQTPKPSHDATAIWHPLQFWFNEDVRLAIPSVSIPFGQRFITTSLTSQDNLVFSFPNLYLRTVDNVGTDPWDTDADYRCITYTPITSSAFASEPESLSILGLDLYINNIFVNPEVHDIFIKRIGFNLIRVYREQRVQINTSTGSEQLTQLKWPIEYFYLCVKPTWNSSNDNPNKWRDWHRCTKLDDATCDQTQRVEVPSPTDDVNRPADGAPGMLCQDPICPATYPVSRRTVSELGVSAHGICLYDQTDARFYSDYLPYHYGGRNITTPTDEGAHLITFNLYPGTYQPSGHVNVSRAREFFVEYSSDLIGVSTTSNTNVMTANLIVVAKALNFLLITDGSAVLRYST